MSYFSTLTATVSIIPLSILFRYLSPEAEAISNLPQFWLIIFNVKTWMLEHYIKWSQNVVLERCKNYYQKKNGLKPRTEF